MTLAVVGAILGIAGDAYHLVWDVGDLGERSDLLATPTYRLHGVAIGVGYGLLLAAAVGLVAHRAVGSLARAGLVLVLVGTPFVVGDYWAESVVTPAIVATQPTLADADASGAHLAAVIVAFAIFSLGWIILAVAAYRERWVARPLAGLAAVGAAVAFTPFAGSHILLFAGVGAMAVVARR